MRLFKVFYFSITSALSVYFYTKGMAVPFNLVLYFLWTPGFAWEAAKTFENKKSASRGND